MARVQRGLQYRNSSRDQIDQQTVKAYRISGRTQIIGSGECTIEVTFPVVFSERPGFSFGYELAELQVPETTNLPLVSAGVFRWTREEKVEGVFNYTGAILGVVAQGNPRYCWLHWHFEGKAFQNPVSGF